MPKRLLKALLHAVSLAAAFPFALASGFGRREAPFQAFAQGFALFPGLPGDYLRIAYYRLTLASCSLSGRVSFGSFFAHPQARLAAGVYIGSYCVIGLAVIGERTQIASGVQILSGARQHARGPRGEISGAEGGVFTIVTIGADCWIGAAAVVMADVGAGTTVGAGSVVTRPLPPASVAAGSPAKVIGAAAGG